jgi:prophage antirepressor-like protein
MNEERQEKEMTENNSAMRIFRFESKQVRVVKKDGQPWWVAKDACDILELTNPTEAVKALDDDEKFNLRNPEVASLLGLEASPTLYPQGLNIISESGLYALIIRSNKPEARKFRKWITSEVLPALRRTGEYATPDKQKEKTKKNDELAAKRVEIAEKNANWRMAKLVLEGIDKFKDVMTPESKTVFMAKYA